MPKKMPNVKGVGCRMVEAEMQILSDKLDLLLRAENFPL